MTIIRNTAVAVSAAAAAVVLFTMPGEPATWALMLTGIAALGGGLRWRRALAAAAA
ncbi:MAG TPA: PEP-CTERM sorting domain-containing protein [Caulobacteraceae bacterium]|jgi:hypothetical protein|nr:PEP-CTERM sorting domain-containing protein [Caulobacteraceae bacterium]